MNPRYARSQQPPPPSPCVSVMKTNRSARLQARFALRTSSLDASATVTMTVNGSAGAAVERKEKVEEDKDNEGLPVKEEQERAGGPLRRRLWLRDRQGLLRGGQGPVPGRQFGLPSCSAPSNQRYFSSWDEVGFLFVQLPLCVCFASLVPEGTSTFRCNSCVKEEIQEAKKQLDKKDVDYEAALSTKLSIARKIFNLEKEKVLNSSSFQQFLSENELDKLISEGTLHHDVIRFHYYVQYHLYIQGGAVSLKEATVPTPFFRPHIEIKRDRQTSEVFEVLDEGPYRSTREQLFSIGQMLRIRKGPLKGYLCRVVRIFRNDVTVKLDSLLKIVTQADLLSVPANRFLETK
uniref:4-alpha-glucanotransferase n=1 Tax=Zea mays TaxID=4577 RepID=A0A1P8YYJ7_MAIZE|nr:4-alpha-glucanotransferase [Zea mays]